MIGPFDSYGFMQLAPRFRQFGEPGFMPWANDYDPLINYSVQLDPTFDWGFRPAVEPYRGQVVIDPKPVTLQCFCREAIAQLENDFTLEDIVWLMDETGFPVGEIRRASSFLLHKMGYHAEKIGRYIRRYYAPMDYEI